MRIPTFHVRADWDPEAEVWVAISDDVPGLGTEAATIEELLENLRMILPELLEADEALPAGSAFAFELTSHRREQLRLAS